MALNGDTVGIKICKWHSHIPAANKRFQRNLHIIAKWLRRVMLRYGMGYVDMTIIGDNYCNITAKKGSPTEGDYVVDDAWL